MAFHPDKAIDYLRGAISDGRLAHAYLISGSDMLGREEFASMLLRETGGIVGEGIDEMAVRGEIRLIRPESKSRRITVDQVRELERALQFGTEGGRLKIGVVADADRMQVQSENAFLKTLEEPPAGSLLLLLTGQPEALLDTIISRCIRVPLIDSGSKTRGASAGRLLDLLARHFGETGKGGTGRAIAFERAFVTLLRSEKEEVQKDFEKRQKDEAAHYKQRTDGAWLDKRENYYKALIESEYLRRRAELLNVLLGWFGDVYRQKQGFDRLDYPSHSEVSDRLAQAWDNAELSRRFRALETLQRHLETNIQEALALEAGFIAAFG